MKNVSCANTEYIMYLAKIINISINQKKIVPSWANTESVKQYRIYIYIIKFQLNIGI